MSPGLHAAAHDQADVVAHAWRQRVAEFTHDWLQNRFLPRVHGLIAVSGGSIDAPPAVLESLISGVREWERRGVEALLLADEYCDTMSPLRAIGELAPAVPLDVAEYLRWTACELWRTRHRVKARLDAVRAAHVEAQRSFALWKEMLPREDAAALRVLAGACEVLNGSLTLLPASVGL